MTNPTALIVDDEPDIRELLEITLGRMEITTRSAADLAQAYALLEQEQFDLCLTDMQLPDGNGIALVEQISRNHPELPVAMITAHGNMESAILALKAGAFDFVSKPIDLQLLRQLVETALKLHKPKPALPQPRPPAAASNEPQLLGQSPAIDMVRSMIAKLARSQAPVYISGESGTGKELAARLIHAQGPRAEGPFIAVNCGAIPHELVESEFFGHKKGSFTGAISDKEGLFQAADGGTLFLDEVADLPLGMQVKLLRAIQEKSIRPVGAQQESSIDVRILSATHKDLAKLVNRGEFRQDLFYRINVIELHIPALREREGDITLLTEHLLTRLAIKNGLPKTDIEPSAMKALCNYRFPGNIRELENTLERAVTLCEGNRVTVEDLQLPEPPAAAEENLNQPLEAYLGDIEKQAIIKALEETRWNRTAAAKKLGISFRALRYRLEKLGLD
ncbi:MAG: sigma-54 dependent transcriptional regulator [Candidatus Polarisedimenticolaceae bacterium]|nr:sigma-54 dependent transcriptional regulator [Candidatus Polarisedimenticolaceae bacterium]